MKITDISYTPDLTNLPREGKLETSGMAPIVGFEFDADGTVCLTADSMWFNATDLAELIEFLKAANRKLQA